jgi:hypothetical protein
MTLATPVARNANEATVAPMVGLAESSFGGSLESGGRFYVSAFGKNLASVSVKMFTQLIYFIKEFCSLCRLLSMRFTINCITVQHTEKVNSRQL